MGIFPEIIERPEIENEPKRTTYSPLFDFEKKKMVLKDGKVVLVSGKEKIKQWIELLIRTEVDKYKVYQDTGFGLTNLYNLQGHQLFTSNYGISEMKSELKRSIEAKEEVTSVQNIVISNNFDKLKIELTVIVDEEVISSEVNI